MNMKINKILKTTLAADFMPQDEISTRIISERSKKMAMPKINKTQDEDTTQFIKFRLGNELYGIHYDKVKEVIANTLLTYVPHVPAYVAGVINHRGILIAVVDLKILFKISFIEKTKSKYILIIKAANKIVGLLIDNTEGSDTYHSERLDPPIPSGGINLKHVLGIYQGDTTIINIESILADTTLFK